MCQALYTNIDLQEGLEAAHEALEEREDKEIPTDFILKLLEIILKFNIFEFDKEFYIQLIGVAMGCVPAVSFANIFMAKKIDPKILEAAMKFSNNDSNPVTFLKRFIDDIFMVWRGSIENLHKFLKMLNEIHPTIKFTATHTTPNNAPHSCDCPPAKSIPFLDTSCSVSGNNIKTTLYKKPTDRNQYLLPSSCHPAHVTENIPFSLALRIVRICSDIEDREHNFQKLKQMLLERNYKPKIIDAAINKARLIKREEALKKVVKTRTSDRPVLSVLYDPRLPSIPAIVNRHYRSMVSNDNHLAEVFPKPPLVAFRRNKNIREMVIKAKVTSSVFRASRTQVGLKKCTNVSCITCPYSIPGKVVKSHATNVTVEVNTAVTCNTPNVIYCISCNHCGEQYVGETHRPLKDRFGEHRGYVNRKEVKKATGDHFNSSGHSISDMRIQIVEKMFTRDIFFRKQREHFFINKFDTKRNGLNKNS